MGSPPVVDLPFVDEQVATALSTGLEAVESRLREAVVSEDAFITEASQHLMPGGKRFRATLVLLAAQFGAADAPGVVPGAVVVELTHLATLYHDDVMDGALVRRGTPSVNARWSNTLAILVGDYLFARASRVLADLGEEAIQIQSETFSRLVRGQIKETIGPADGDDPIEHYLQVLADKTGSLIATSGQFGAMLSGAPADVVNRITRACEAIGVAWQLSDDILDIASSSVESGKTPGTDLKEGIRTLPVLHVLASTDPGDDKLRDLLSGDLTDDGLHAEALALLRANPAMDRARAELQSWADRAQADISGLPDIPAKAAFEALCGYVVSRTG
ncbi:polyprenyl synthetase family protein [Rhizohabitans arisaemae]|uniref:polyprenyl synthetase family protein n=1 Tax=Rhizohabitans arisaemae TaxID=2720610 RepID=UPI0024B0F3FD|nr:polyprenyl synthetase family protein [Rhizohabitans arisaemae]